MWKFLWKKNPIIKNKLWVTAAIIVGCALNIRPDRKMNVKPEHGRRWWRFLGFMSDSWCWPELLEGDRAKQAQLLWQWPQRQRFPVIHLTASEQTPDWKQRHQHEEHASIFKITWLHVQLDQRKKKTAAILRTRLKLINFGEKDVQG